MRNTKEETLDPDDWEATRALAHRMVDEAIEHLVRVRERPVWTPMPEDVRARLQTGMPEHPAQLDEVYREYRDNVAAYPMGNIHPRFWGWYMGASNFTGALGDFLAAVEGSNLGGGNTGAAQVEQQVVDWLKEIAGFPKSASGTLTSGGSMANLVAHTVIRNLAAGYDVRKEGIAGLKKPLRFYASDQVHSCHQKALETLGLGAKALVEVASDDRQRMRLDALEAAIAQDRANGLQPACVIGTAGTTNTGAIDDLTAIADLCDREGLWFHVDGCIGGVLRLAPDHAHLVAGIERAGSVAIDPHKWLHTPFEAGAVLIKDPEAHFATFEMHGPYLQLQERGMIAGKFLADYGLELSRGFRALKIWMAFKEQGSAKFGRLIAKDIALARYMAEQVEAHPLLELFAPVDLNIVCFRHIAEDEDASKALNTEIMLRLQERGLAVPSDTTVQGKHGLRCAFNNHRTRREDIDGFLVDVLEIAQEIDRERALQD
ncbi:MAG: pyridoxal-dependent decarboxylase [Yoonia sp.]|uniref:pyridoxal phosphate-dependent decarboxylase family protein n=1 Tax=Yoonia sp. TaxID=2212373 RepID=UPI00273FE738|nr:pyridoxal-dependent decarboxylase [Yoonia sp.]MDP5084885.1 pyridoxal-dependent decarboxylase [Yoonia sp.]MDP5361768.1 pyridoxal-dependent decarboxylase [Paracoccaceae bacterium]